MSASSYGAAALDYFAGHAIDPAIADEAGVLEIGGALAFPYSDEAGTFERRRSLNGGKPKQPRGRPLCCWWPAGRSGKTALVCEGESDALAALSAIGGAGELHAAPAELLADVAVCAMPSASFPADRLAAELDGFERVILAPDADDAGDRFATRAAEALRAAGIACARLPLPGGADLAEHLAAAEDRADALAQALADAEADDASEGDSEGVGSPAPSLVTRGSAVRSKSIRWAWIGRLALGYLTVETGIEGLGKSVFAAWMLACLTRGDLPGEWRDEAVDVLIVAGEDGIADTWAPRLTVARADMDRVAFLNLDVLDVGWDLRDGIKQLRAAVEQTSARVVFIDAALDHMPAPRSGESINSPTFVRQALGPLKRLMRDLNLVGLFSMHPPKARSSDFRDLVQASQAFSAIPRVGLLFAWHPDDAELPEDDRRRVLVRGKGNIGRNPGALEFRIVGHEHEHDDGTTAEVALVEDVVPSAITMADLNPGRLVGDRKPTKAEEAAEVIHEMLRDGDWHLSEPITDALAARGLNSASTRTHAMGLVRAEKRKRPGESNGPWEWRIAQDSNSDGNFDAARARSLTDDGKFDFEGLDSNNGGKAPRVHDPSPSEGHEAKFPSEGGGRARTHAREDAGPPTRVGASLADDLTRAREVR